MREPHFSLSGRARRSSTLGIPLLSNCATERARADLHEKEEAAEGEKKEKEERRERGAGGRWRLRAKETPFSSARDRQFFKRKGKCSCTAGSEEKERSLASNSLRISRILCLRPRPLTHPSSSRASKSAPPGLRLLPPLQPVCTPLQRAPPSPLALRASAFQGPACSSGAELFSRAVTVSRKHLSIVYIPA